MQNRREFLSNLFKGLVVAAFTPQIVTHGLKLVNKGNLLLSDWTEADMALYNPMPIYLAELAEERRQAWSILMQKRFWSSNTGNTMRSIRFVESPRVYDFPDVNDIPIALSLT